MDVYSTINKAVNHILIENPDKKIAIYPFGEIGLKTKEILNWRYGCKESLIVDNYLATINSEIFSLDKVDNPLEYIWILATVNPAVHAEILQTMKRIVPMNQIVDIYAYMYPGEAVYSEGYKLLSKIGKPGTNSCSCGEFLQLIEKKKNEGRIISIAEIGVDIGATAVEACKRLESEDTYYFFDFDHVVEDLLYDLKRVPEICCNLIGKGNSHCQYDSYSWSLSKLLFWMRNKNLEGIFDVVYLDGAHTFMHDGLACCLLKELIKKDGYFVFDDVFWSYGNSPASNPKVNPQIKELLTEEQIEDYQVQRVINAFMIEDRRFQEVHMPSVFNSGRAVYKKSNTSY